MSSLKVVVCLLLIAVAVNSKDLRPKNTKAVVIDSNLSEADQKEIADKFQIIYEKNGENLAWEYQEYLEQEKFTNLFSNVFTNFEAVKMPHQTVYYIILDIAGQPVHAYGLSIF
ncbi:hypothetical protein ILUMI_08776 [Ignelater luminosus]|uniref:Uncharacterized protein n=1 Tax=Ignelater luminosus TaxID=2038154 RepID=A0A8K0DAM2_IGNLU|nr:hypothetical protein ILUMI_08776 [Ignelater luminosus]